MQCSNNPLPFFLFLFLFLCFFIFIFFFRVSGNGKKAESYYFDGYFHTRQNSVYIDIL